MKSNKFILFLFLFITLIGYSQERWSLQFRPGLNVPFNDLGQDNLELGFGFEVRAAYNLMPHLKGYGGWSWNMFKTAENSMRNTTRLSESSFVFGAELKFPFENKSVNYFAYVGGVVGRIHLQDAMNTFNEKSDFGFGWQLGAGAEFRLDDQWSLKPDVRYRSLTQDIEIGAATIDVDLNYISVGLGLVRKF